MAEGFVYVLVNPTIPGYLKVGKTTRLPEDCAKELSAATGVPAPFMVAYDAMFSDCDQAETFIHTLLEARGVHKTSDREFFAASLRQVIDAIKVAESSLGTATRDAASAENDPIDVVPPESLTSELLDQAFAHLYGWRGQLRDKRKAEALYRQAMRIGSGQACHALGGILADSGRREESLQVYARGGELGSADCWQELALVYSGEAYEFDDDDGYDPYNARICWRRFFRIVEPGDYNLGPDPIYFMLARYVRLTKEAGPDPEDTRTIQEFVVRFETFLRSEYRGAELDIKLLAIAKLVAA